jgi:hypothetical protein
VKHTYSVHVAQIQGVVLAKETAELIPNGARPVKVQMLEVLSKFWNEDPPNVCREKGLLLSFVYKFDRVAHWYCYRPPK